MLGIQAGIKISTLWDQHDLMETTNASKMPMLLLPTWRQGPYHLMPSWVSSLHVESSISGISQLDGHYKNTPTTTTGNFSQIEKVAWWPASYTSNSRWVTG